MNHTRFYVLLASFAFLLALSLPAQAQTIIRDTEIETYMAEWFAPVFRAAGMSPDQVDIILVQDNDINAFVAGGANIFFFTGLLQKTDDPGEVIGVMAHELGHVSGGHLIRAREAMERASYESILGALIGIGAAVATGDGGAAATLGAGSASMAQRRFLANARTYEASADQAALNTLDTAQINPSGFLKFMEKLGSQELLPESRQSEYVRTHPLTRDRIDSIRAGIERSTLRSKPYPAAWVDQHARMKAKLLAFLQPEQVAWVYDDRDTSIPASYARAVAAWRTNKVQEAINGIDALITREPDNPYFHELKGQMLVEFGRVKEALPSYKKAVTLAPDSGLIRIALAHAQIESAGNDRTQIEEAIGNLKVAAQEEPRSTRVHRLLATAYGRLGNDPAARLHLAEEALLQQKTDYARQQAEIALKNLKPATPQYLRAQDILAFIEQKKAE